MTKYVSIATGKQYSGDIPDTISIVVSEQAGNCVVDRYITGSSTDTDLLDAYMYRNGYIQADDYVQKESYGQQVIIAFNLEDNTSIKEIQTAIIANQEDKVNDLHVTILPLGDMHNLDKSQVMQLVESVSQVCAPISGVFNGYARFESEDDKTPIVLLLDSPYLIGFYEMLKQYVRSFVDVPVNHGFTPHVTLGYEESSLGDGSVVVPHIDCTFSSVWLYWGTEHIEFPFSGSVVYKQLPIDDASIQNLIEIRKNIFADEVDTLAEKVYYGDISIGDWEEKMRQMIRELHSSTAAIGKGGWDQMTYSDWGRLGPVMKDQYRYLHGFAESIAENKDTISIEAIKARSHMYGNAGGYSSILVQAGDVLAKKLPWLPKDGSTECLVNCKCYWRLLVVDSIKRGNQKFKIVQATWHNRPAEHCSTCVKRDNKVFIIEVHETVEVPETIG